jgi:hypothetical protein
VPARSSAQAAHEFSETLQLVVSTVTDGVLTIRDGYYPSPNPHALTFADSSTVRMHGDVRLALSVDLRCRMVQNHSTSSRQAWDIEIVSYMYAIRERNRAEIVSWHWHPGIPDLPSFPHLHLGPAAQIGRPEFHRAHVPTGIVTLAEVVRSAITDFHVEPRRADWRAILEDSSDST